MKTWLIVIMFAFTACSTSKPGERGTTILSNYWYQGKAEVSVYDLEVNRYQDVHPGEAILIQVSEDFLPEEQVKSDRGKTESSIPAIKTNMTERFSTGLYDYSVMTSVFTEAMKHGKTLKSTCSSQDWCGQSFIQLNRRGKIYELQGFSYFEREGDTESKVKPDLLEDELWNLIRLDYEAIPKGTYQMLPSSRILAHLHLPLAPIETTITLDEGLPEDGIHTLFLEMPDIQRSKRILFQSKSPHQIISWEDSYPSAFDRKIRSTKATLRKRQLVDYWNKNRRSDALLRDSLDTIKY